MPDRATAPAVSFSCEGHSAISARHVETLEFTRDESITPRASCVVGVGSDHDDAALLRLRGDVEVELRCGEHSDRFRATVSPFFLGGRSIVFRIGRGLRGRTFAFNATKGAAELDRGLVDALRQRGSRLDVTMREVSRATARGVLFVVALPMGNDDDLSPRAAQTLAACDVILAEDTRTFRAFTRRHGLAVAATVLSYHDHNEQARAGSVLAELEAGARVALVSDAGTPLMSDPGYVVVSQAVAAGHDVSPVPGPNAVIAALSACGLAVDTFSYVGFLPRRAAARQAALRVHIENATAFVVHEAPHRVAALLADLALVAPECRVCVARDLTKVFEEFVHGSAAELATEYATADARGEFTIVVSPPAASDRDDAPGDASIDRLVDALLAEGVSPRTVAQALAASSSLSKSAAYERVLARRDATR